MANTVKCGPHRNSCLWGYLCPNHREEAENIALQNIEPCPNCGSDLIAIGHNREGWKAECFSCDSSDRQKTKGAAARAWNRRVKERNT